MSILIAPFTPLLPSDAALQRSTLPDLAVRLSVASAELNGLIAPETQKKIKLHMAVINSYYSNLIEGNNTQPYEIKQAQAGDFSNDLKKRDLQMESLAHITVQHWIAEQNPDVNELFTPEFIQAIHGKFYKHIPKSLHKVKKSDGSIIRMVVPGQWRNHDVVVGRHVPSSYKDIPELMKIYCDVYHPDNFKGDKKVIAVLAAHHRFAWLHPFSDGNGRVMRLHTDAVLKAIGFQSCGVWNLSRGLAKTSEHYKSALAYADSDRQGDLDGRGILSEKALSHFCHYMLETALDQVTYISELLALDKIRQRINGYVHARNEGRVSNFGKLKENAALVLFNAFVHGELSRPLAIESCGMPERSARRLLAQLKEEGLLSETSRRSNLTWEIPVHAVEWYFPLLTPQG